MKMDSNQEESKKAIIAGAGPAGLTAAYELLDKTNIYPIIYESSSAIGGISQTINCDGNRIDIGGHRFFSKNHDVMNWWAKVMPLQGKPSIDDILLNDNTKTFVKNGPDPEKTNRVSLIRHRVSRIFFLKKFFDYPISMKMETFKNMGFSRMMYAGFGYLWSTIHKLPETSLENFYINRFGRPLYEMFFEDYTEKVWGIHPSKLGADWGSQRVKGLSIGAVLKDVLSKQFGVKDKKDVETSLIEEFVYPKLGPGQLWETVANDIKDKSGRIIMECTVTGVHIKNNNVESVTIKDSDGIEHDEPCDYFLSTMPIKDLIPAIDGIDVPASVKKIAMELPYRDFITVGLCVTKLKISNHTKIKTFNNRVPDTWIYIQERNVKLGRLQIFNNWSPYLVKDYKKTMWIGLEYFCTEGDSLWNMKKDCFINMAIGELVKIGIIDKEDVLNATLVKIKKAYPAYFGSYYKLGEVKTFLDSIPNLFCLGRNGQHRYNNMDHSMLTAMECVKNLSRNNLTDKSNIWNVNTEDDYHESNK